MAGLCLEVSSLSILQSISILKAPLAPKSFFSFSATVLQNQIVVFGSLVYMLCPSLVKMHVTAFFEKNN